MSLTPVQQTDPFELPVAFRGRLMTYQWCSPLVCGELNPDYDKLLENGWVPVPAQWLKGWYKGSRRFVTVDTSVLLCHAYPRDEEADRFRSALEEKEKELQGLHEKLVASATAHAAALARPEPKPRHRLLKWLFDLISTEKSP